MNRQNKQLALENNHMLHTHTFEQYQQAKGNQEEKDVYRTFLITLERDLWEITNWKK